MYVPSDIQQKKKKLSACSKQCLHAMDKVFLNIIANKDYGYDR